MEILDSFRGFYSYRFSFGGELFLGTKMGVFGQIRRGSGDLGDLFLFL